MSIVVGEFTRGVRGLLRLGTTIGSKFEVPYRKSVSCMSQDAHLVQPEPALTENEDISPEFVNRNPRNLEQLALARKDRGWETQWPSREFYHRLVFTRSRNYVTAEVFAPESSAPVLSCSTKEWALKQELRSTCSVAACQAVGEVLAQRCREAGLLRLYFRVVPWTFRSESVKQFRMAMKGGGVKLCEPRRKFVD